ncbi:hypothetical protein [Burkholderia sp. PU8-34]
MANKLAPQMTMKTPRAKRRSAMAAAPMRQSSTFDATRASSAVELIDASSSSGASINAQPQVTTTDALNRRCDLGADSPGSFGTGFERTSLQSSALMKSAVFRGFARMSPVGGTGAFVRHGVESFQRVVHAESALRRLAGALTLHVPERRFCQPGG